MNINSYTAKFTEKAINAGYSYDTIKKCLSYAEILIKNNLPVIYNTSHLSSHVGYSKKYLKRAAFYTPFFYRKFAVSKKKGGSRIISEPLPSLKEIQHWVLNRILYNVDVSIYAKAYVPKKSIKEHLRFHKNRKKVVTIDLVDFFGSIKFESIQSVFQSLGYSDLISNLLTKLCCLEKVLPQGAPTSPYLSNIIFKPLDSEIAEFCIGKGIKYSRYADDLAFSGDFDHEELIYFITEVVAKEHFQINPNKTRIMERNRPQLVSGVLVNEKFQIGRKQRDEVRQAVYFIEKYGLDNHLERINCQKANYVKHLLGKINYMLFINPKDAKLKYLKDKLLNYRVD